MNITEVSFAVGALGTIIGVASYILQMRASNDKARLELLVEDHVRRLQDGVNHAHNISELAYSHLDAVRRCIQEIPSSPERSTALDEVTWLHGDVTSAARVLERIRAEVESLHFGLFQRAPISGRRKTAPPPLVKKGA